MHSLVAVMLLTAAPKMDAYRAADLAALKLVLKSLAGPEWKSATVTVPADPHCTLEWDGTALTSSAPQDCSGLWGAMPPNDVALKVKTAGAEERVVLKADPITEVAATFYSAGSTNLALTGVGAYANAVLFVNGEVGSGWRRVADGDGKTLLIDGAITANLAGGLTLIGESGAKPVKYALKFCGATQPVATLAPPTRASNPSPRVACRAAFECKAAKAAVPNGDPFFCVQSDVDGKLTRLPGDTADDFVVVPNRKIHVFVRGWADKTPVVSMTGTAALSDTVLEQNIPQAGDCIPPIDRTYDFAPRASGQAPVLSVKFMSDDGKTEESSVNLELIVETLYYGALRLGLGLGFGEFDHGYAAQKLNGSPVSEVVQTSTNNVDLEIVLGFAFFGWWGRSYAHGDVVHPAPYIGLGLLATGNSLQVMRAAYAGVELELGKNFSIALTGVARFVQLLPKGSIVGSPVPDGALPTRLGVGFGGAIIFNLAPEFFKFAATGVKP